MGGGVDGQREERRERARQIRTQFPPTEIAQYGRGSRGEPLHAHIFKPPHGTPSVGGCLLLFHGSGFAFQMAEALYARCAALAECGIVAISCTYSILPVDLYTELEGGWGTAAVGSRRLLMSADEHSDVFEVRMPSVITRACHDGRAALAYVKGRAAELGVDAQKIGVCGTSAGGAVAKGMVYGSGTGPGTEFGLHSAASYKPFKVATGDRPCLAMLLSPCSEPPLPSDGLSSDTVPLLVQHGMADDAVLCEWSRRFVATIREHESDTKQSQISEYYYPNEGHGFNSCALAAAHARELEFLTEHGLVHPEGVSMAGDHTATPLGAIQKLFRGMRTGDSDAVRSVLAPHARFSVLGLEHGGGARGGTAAEDAAVSIKAQSVDPWVDAIGNSKGKWDEQIYDVEVRVDDRMASAWVPYTFYLDGVIDHCGVNSIELLRDQEGWKITQLSDTRREGPRCPDPVGAAALEAEQAKL